MSGITNMHVAVLDVLGFTSQVDRKPLAQLLSNYQDLINSTKALSKNPALRFYGDGRQPELIENNIPYFIFSDTIIVWCPPEKEQLVPILLRTCSELIKHSIEIGFPLRAGLGYGEAIIDPGSHIFLGRAITNAYKAQCDQDWIGGVLHPSSVQSKYFQNNLEVFLGARTQLLKYPAPAKPGIERANLTDYSLRCCHSDHDRIRDRLISMGNDALSHDLNPHQVEGIRRKYQNTIDFVEYDYKIEAGK